MSSNKELQERREQAMARGMPSQLAVYVDRAANAEIIRQLLAGKLPGPKRDAVLLNAGAALFVAGRSKSFAEGWLLAAEVLASGQATAKLAELSRRS